MRNLLNANVSGSVKTHAHKMFQAMPLRTAEKRRVAPTPRIELEIACVVDTGMPKCEATPTMPVAVVSAAKP